MAFFRVRIGYANWKSPTWLIKKKWNIISHTRSLLHIVLHTFLHHPTICHDLHAQTHDSWWHMHYEVLTLSEWLWFASIKLPLYLFIHDSANTQAPRWPGKQIYTSVYNNNRASHMIWLNLAWFDILYSVIFHYRYGISNSSKRATVVPSALWQSPC